MLSYRPLAHSLARRYAAGRPADGDLEQAACEGLVKAIIRFDPARGTPFTTFAVPTILGEVRRFLRDTGWAAHVPRGIKERALELGVAREQLLSLHGREPSVAELARATSRCPEEVVEALMASASRAAVPLHDVQPGDHDGLAVADRLGAEDPGYEHAVLADAVAGAMPALTADERAVVALRFGGDLTQRQIAERLGCSRSRVGRLLDSGIGRLRAEAA